MNRTREPRLFEGGHPVSEFILNWWEGLKQNRGARAELRRCKNLKDVEGTSAYMRCYWELLRSFDKKDNKPSWDQAAIIIGLAAHVENNVTKYRKKENGKETEQDFYFGYQLAAQKGVENKNPKLSELRFRRLMKIKNKDREKLFRFLIQVIRLLDKKVNLLDLFRISYYWGEKAKRNLAYKYYERPILDN